MRVSTPLDRRAAATRRRILATAADGTRVFVKAIDREHRDADALAAVGRYLAFRHVEDETPFATAKQRVEHEALLASLAAHAGVHAALPDRDRSRSTPGRACSCSRAIDGPLDRRGRTRPRSTTRTVTALWKEVARLRRGARSRTGT